VQPSGRLGNAQMYEYVQPQEAGEAFENQQRLRAVAPIERVVVDISAGSKHSDGASSIPDKDIRRAVKAAMADGWELERKGDGHWTLHKGQHKVGVAGTPKNPSAAAIRILRLVRDAQVAS